MPAPQQRLGRLAEDAAAHWLTSRGWRVLERRWRSSFGEIDLICLDRGGCLVGVEVKLRRTGRTGGPAEAIDGRRLTRLRTSLGSYAAERHVSVAGLRIDLVALVPAGSSWRLSRTPGIDQW
ncbi:MAG TPA: YraN family protein [Candidatus Limnocylindria bacterium]|jgi:putative endonuclease